MSPTSRGSTVGANKPQTAAGKRDVFYRLRVGSYRLMFDLLDDEHALLVLGIIERRDLERWLRGN
jgi:mRNA-degrading endonuclease RelE of RelBE toxin-antitoxin system